MMYLGMYAQTGRRIIDMDHITQSITDIVTTPVTTRCMRRGYGSLLSDLIDDPQNPLLRLKAMSAAYSAIMRWEPRIVLTRVILTEPNSGKMTLELHGQRTDLADTFNLAIPIGGDA